MVGGSSVCRDEPGMVTSMSDSCPFCHKISQGDIRWRSGDVAAFADGFPLNPGHTLVVPAMHAANLFDLPNQVRMQLWEMVDQVREALVEEYAPDGFNIGVNVGAAAGQTVGHVHVHVIPRHHGDVQDPRGGVRWVVPSKAVYWDDAH